MNRLDAGRGLDRPGRSVPELVVLRSRVGRSCVDADAGVRWLNNGQLPSRLRQVLVGMTGVLAVQVGQAPPETGTTCPGGR